MKTILTLSALLLTVSLSFGQGKDQQLYKAVSAKDTLQVEKLLNKGADANYKVKFGFLEMSMLIAAVQKNDFKTVQLLLDHKAEVDFRDAFKSTALMYAAHSGNRKIVAYLISKGADVYATDDQGNSVLSAAREGKHPEVIALIESYQKK
jgi:ankyrin repeat protein